LRFLKSVIKVTGVGVINQIDCFYGDIDGVYEPHPNPSPEEKGF
jgi:hypothetical protein